METRTLTIAATAAGDDEAIRAAGRALAEGQLVVFPTETVYGLGTSAADGRAVADLSRLKERPPDKPFTLHLADPDEAERYAGPLSPLALRFIRKAWPGPLTLVVPDRRGASHGPPALAEEAVYYDHTVGLRCPSHKAGRAILRAAGVPVVATSANLGGRPAPREATEALAQLAGKVHLVVDAGPAPLAAASTVVRLRPDDSYEVLREGAVAASRVARMATTRIVFVCTGNQCRSPMAAGLARRRLAERLGTSPDALPSHGLEVLSVGTAAGAGYPASANAIRAMADVGVDIRSHLSRPMTIDVLRSADYIWVMTGAHYQAVARLAPEAKVALVDPSGREVADPVGGDIEQYRACARHLDAALAQRVAEIV